MAQDFGDAPQLPSIPAVDDSNLTATARAVKETLEVWQGLRGDGLDRVITLRDLLSAELGDRISRQNLADRLTPSDLSLDVQPEPAIPPTPENLEAQGGMQGVILTWDFPALYTRLANFEIWRSATDALGDAVHIASPLASVYTDDVGPDAVWYYWVRAVSDAAVSPFNAVAGTRGSTAINVDAALAALTGAITETQLYATLGARIDLIDGPASLPGSVAARVYAEQQERISADQAEATARTTLAATIGGSSGNMIDNAEFAVNLDGWGFATNDAPANYIGPARNLSADWTVGDGTAYVKELAAYNAGRANIYYDCFPAVDAPVVSGQRYQFSAYLGAQRCSTSVLIQWLDVNHNTLAYAAGDNNATNAAEAAGGSVLNGYKRCFIFANAPGGAAYARCVVRKGPTSVGNPDSYGFFTRLFFSEAREGQTTLDPYSPGGNTKAVTVALQSESTVRADQTGYLGAQYTLRLDLGGIVGGFGTSGTSAPGKGATIDFGIRANKFYIVPPEGVSNVGAAAFTYLAVPTTINGVVRPAGMYVSDAFIGDGVIARAKIGLAAIDSARIDDLAVTEAKIGNLAVTEAKIRDLAVTNAKISDLAVTNAKISDLDAGKINVGTLNAGRIGAGSITADKIDVGFSRNLVANSAPGRWNDRGWVNGFNNTGLTPTVPTYDELWCPAGASAMYVNIPSGTPAAGTVFDLNNTNVTGRRYPVSPGKRYEVSAYLSAHRVDAQAQVWWFDAAGNLISGALFNTVSVAQDRSVSVGGFPRSGGFAVAPANATTAYVGARATCWGQANPYLFVSMLYFGEAGPNQTALSQWSEGGLTEITPGQIVTGSLSAITATIGTLRTATTGARQEITDNVIRTYDSANVLRVKLGDLS